MEIKKRLVMSFKNSTGKNVSISVDNPREDLTELEIKTNMELILAKNVFAPNGETLASLVDARIVQTDTTSYDLVL